MKNDVFIAKLARAAITSSVAGAFLLPQDHSAAVPPPVTFTDSTLTQQTSLSDEGATTETTNVISYPVTELLKDWDKNLEREFRKLAMAEAKLTASQEEMERLEYLSTMRDRLLNAQPVEEILLQLRRDRMLDEIAGTLKKYVEFQESTNKKRVTA